MYIERAITGRIQGLIASFPAVLLTGPRQSGKSTLLMHLLPKTPRYLLDRPSDIIQIQQDPEGVLFGHPGRTLLIDEVQNLPFVFPYLKSYIDDHRQEYGRFVLTGSQHFALMEGVFESLAGRIGIAHLLPLSWSELAQAELVGEAHDVASVATVAQRGFFPELWNHQSPPLISDWWMSYLNSYLDRDVRLLHGVGDLGKFRLLLGLLAARCSQILNVSDLAKDAGIPVSTVRSWLHILEASFVIRLVFPWQANIAKRLVKAPKVFFYDTGLLCWLLGLHSSAALQSSSLWGHVFENLVIMEAVKRLAVQSSPREVFYFRSHDGLEVDLLIQDGTQLEAFEIKSSQTIAAEDLRGLHSLKALISLRRTAVLSLQPTASRNAPIEILPWTEAVHAAME